MSSYECYISEQKDDFTWTMVIFSSSSLGIEEDKKQTCKLHNLGFYSVVMEERAYAMRPSS